MFKLIDVEQTVAEVTSGAVSDDEQLRAFHARLVTTLKLPVLGLLGGKRVQIVTVEYLGNPQRGITLRAFEGDRTVTASILDLTLPGKSAGALTLAGLKRWAGIPDEETARHDLRCLDAHAHLGNWSFSEYSLDTALAHYEVGVRIGEQSIGAAFDGVLPWGHLDNRPFLRCLNGYALALWRKQRFEEALAAFEWLLRLDPLDNQNARVNWLAVHDGGRWDQDGHEDAFA